MATAPPKDTCVWLRDPARGHAEERALIGGVIAPTAPSKGDAVLIRLFLTPLEVWNKFVATGEAKSKFSWPKKIILSFLAGCYLSFGVAFAFMVGGQLGSIKTSDPGLYNLIFGFFGLPFGLTMIIIMGGELFTSDVSFMFSAWVEGKVALKSVAWNLIWSWFGNLCGSLWMVQLYIWSEVFLGKESFEQAVSVKKTSLGFGVAFVRAILCNWLVNIGVWQAMSAQDITGKFVGVFIPITIFFASGFEHCIANQFGISLGIRMNSGISVNTEIVGNFIPVTLGNMVAAMLFIVGAYFCAIGSGQNKFVNMWNSMMEEYLPQPMASWLQTGDVVHVGTDLHPLPIKFVGDRSITVQNGIGSAAQLHGGHCPGDSSHRGMLYKLREVASSLLRHHGHDSLRGDRSQRGVSYASHNSFGHVVNSMFGSHGHNGNGHSHNHGHTLATLPELPLPPQVEARAPLPPTADPVNHGRQTVTAVSRASAEETHGQAPTVSIVNGP